MIVLIDNTVFSNFAIINQIDLLQSALGNTAATVREVYEEYQEGVRLDLLPLHDWGWLTVFELTDEERSIYQELRSHLGSGESACIAIAYARKYAILTDDRAGRKTAQQKGCPVSGLLACCSGLSRLAASH